MLKSFLEYIFESESKLSLPIYYSKRLRDFLYDIEKTSKELELLLQDLRLNPTRYINVSLFGKKNKPYKTPNDSIKNTKN